MALKIIGVEKTQEFIEQGLLGNNVDKQSKPALSHYTATYRKELIFNTMRQIVLDYLKLWYV